MRRLTILPSALSLFAAAGAPANAQSIEDFYKGKQIEFIVAAEAGSIYDTWARMLSRYMPKYMPGNPTFVPKNMPGAGHIRAAGYSFHVAPKDGTSIVTFSHNIPTSYVLKNPAITFNVGKFQWLGSPDLPGRMCVVSTKAKVQNAGELFDRELLVAGAGAGGGISQTPKLVSGLLGMKMKLVEGYKGGGDGLLAVERGEVDGMCATVEGIENERPGFVAGGKLKALFNMERKSIPGLNAPSIFEFAKTEEQLQVLAFYGSTMEFGFPSAAPPGVPADRVDALRRALDGAVKDPSFRNEVTRAKMKSVPVTGEELTQRMDELVATPAEVIKKTSALIGGKSHLAMGRTIIEKILSRASGGVQVKPGDIAVVAVDTAVLLDTSFMPHVWRDVLKLADPDKVVVVFDHKVPANNPVSAKGHMTGRAFVKKFGIKRFHDLGREVGISHVLVTDRAYALPGTVLICADSHTCAAGAWNCAARGVGVPEMVYAITTGKTWFRLGETVRYELTGRLSAGVTTKDVFLHLAGVFGDHTNLNMEFGGEGVAHLSLNARRTIATQAAEVGAEFCLFEADDVLLKYLRSRTSIPFQPQYPDADARYADRRTIDLETIEPQVARPDAVVKNTTRVSDVAGEPIQQAFIGSCANGSLDDFAIAARIVDGRRVAPGVRFIVTPGSQDVYRDALAAGYVATLVEAGALVTNATCGACAGGHMGVVGPGETCITASTRNFKGRMGDPTARIFMASPATVAASAITGVITHPGKFIDGASA